MGRRECHSVCCGGVRRCKIGHPAHLTHRGGFNLLRRRLSGTSTTWCLVALGNLPRAGKSTSTKQSTRSDRPPMLPKRATAGQPPGESRRVQLAVLVRCGGEAASTLPEAVRGAEAWNCPHQVIRWRAALVRERCKTVRCSDAVGHAPSIEASKVFPLPQSLNSNREFRPWC
jgi:hypothetical protein